MNVPYWILNVPSIDATNEKDHDNVTVKHVEFEMRVNTNNNFQFTFEPHSLTEIEIEGKTYSK